MHLVHPRLGRQQRPGQRGGQAELRDRLPHHITVHTQQLAPAVIDQRHTVLPVQHQQTLAHRVQRGLVVVVHMAELGRVHAMGVTAQPGVDHVRADRTQRERARRHPEQGRQLLLHPLADLLDPDARADHPHDVRRPVSPVVDRYDGPHGRSERAGVRLGEGLTPQRARRMAAEVLSDLLLVRVRPADARGIHDRDEVDLGVALDPQRVRLELGRRIVGADRLPHGRCVGDRLRHRLGLPPRGVLGLSAVTDVGEHRVPGDEHRYQHGLHGEQLAGQAAGSRDGDAHVVSLPPWPMVN